VTANEAEGFSNETEVEMRTGTTWNDEYKSKTVTAQEAVKCVKSGDVVGFGLSLGSPTPHLVDALLDRADELRGVRIIDAVPVRHMRLYDVEFMKSVKDSFTYSTYLFNPFNRNLAKAKLIDYQSTNSSDAGPRLGRLCNVAMVSVSPPQVGAVNLGLSNFLSPEMIRGAEVAIAEVNDQMPVVYGDNWMPVSDFDFFVEHSSPIPEFKRKGEPTEIESRIAEHVALHIRDGDCIQMGIGTLPEAIVRMLRDKGKKDLGVHTEMFPMGLPDLVKEGIVTNKLKNIHQGKTVASFCMGDRNMYEFIARNPDCLFYPTSYINAPHVLRQLDNLVAINMDLEVDLMGQLNSERVDYRLVGASGGQLDFALGAAWSKGGRALNVLPSTRKLKNGQVVSTVVPRLSPGAHVIVPHMYVQYVITEYGVADLYYKSMRQRADALIEIAHPDFRAELRKDVKWIFEGGAEEDILTRGGSVA
jgi:4-hydroxybutyrate CoA-transferase